MLVGHLRRRIAEVTAGHDSLIIWGAGSFGELSLQYLPRNVAAVVDSFSDAASLCGLPVIRPEALKIRTDQFAVVICTVAFKDVERWLRDNAVQQRAIRMQELLAEASKDRSARTLMAIDLFNYWKGSYWRTLLWRPQYLLHISYRWLQALRSRRGPLAALERGIANIWHSFNCCFFGIELPPSVEAGPGLHFPHRGGVVVHERARLGSFCGVYQGVTIGANRKGRVPVIGDDVLLWPGVVVVGDCHLGDGTEVGANSTCIGPMEVRNAVLAGSPAKIVKQY